MDKCDHNYFAIIVRDDGQTYRHCKHGCNEEKMFRAGKRLKHHEAVPRRTQKESHNEQQEDQGNDLHSKVKYCN